MTGHANRNSVHLILLLVVVVLASAEANTSTTNYPLGFHHTNSQTKPHLIPPTLKEDDNTEARGGSVTAKIREVVTSGSVKISASARDLVTKRKKIPRTQETVDDLFTRFKVNEVETNLLESAAFKNWDAAVAKVFTHRVFQANDAMVVKLTEQYGDKELASILAAAKEVPETRYVAVNLLRAQMEKWLTQKKDVGDVFRYLKLDEAKYDLLASPVLTRWMAFVDRSYQKSYDVLNGHLSRFDDQGLANFLVGAKGGVAFGRFDYHKVENPILQKWVDAKKSADDVYGLLKLREVEASDFMQSPALATWLTYVTKVDHRFFNLHHGPYELLYKQLIKQYDDTELANILLGPKGEFWKGFHVYKLDDMILEKWKKSGKSADEVYDLLKLRNVEAKDLLQNPALVIWMSFVTRLNRRSHHPYAVLYNRLNADLGNSKLVELIRDAKYGGHTRAMRMAEKLEKEQRIHAASIAKNVRR